MSAHHVHDNGQPDNRYHTIDQWITFCRRYPLVLEWLARPRRLDRNHHIPFLGGISQDGGTVFMDSRFDPVLEWRASQGLFTLDSTETIPDHEVTEYVLVRFYGMNYEATEIDYNPHVWGNTAERLGVMAKGGEWDPYNAAIDRQLKSIEMEQVTRCPRNLALYPYKDDPALLAKIKACQGE